MGSSWAFKITASIIKPTRDALLDYTAYLLLTLSIIAIARVIIGSSDLKKVCYKNGTSVPEEIKRIPDKSLFINNGSVNISISIPQTNSLHEIKLSENNQNQYCTKYYQAFYPYILIVESAILLLIGILWVKMPKIQSLVREFSKLLHQSRKSDWMKTAFASFQSNDRLEVNFLLTTLYSPSTSYNDKAEARCLYEKIQKFSYDLEHSRKFLSFYVRKTVIQLFVWLVSVTINILLFVEMEFYIGCTSNTGFCSHDTFLRIIWFLGQLLLLIYAMFNCASLKWINDNTSSTGQCSMMNFICGCDTSQLNFQCLPYRVAGTDKLIVNDMALLLHLATSSNNKLLPFFTVFLMDEWKEKFSACNESINVSTEHGWSSYRSSDVRSLLSPSNECA